MAPPLQPQPRHLDAAYGFPAATDAAREVRSE